MGSAFGEGFWLGLGLGIGAVVLLILSLLFLPRSGKASDTLTEAEAKKAERAQRHLRNLKSYMVARGCFSERLIEFEQTAERAHCGDLDAQVSVIKAMIELAARRGDVTYAARQMFEYFVVGIVPRPVADNKIDLIADFSFFRKEWPEDVVPAFVRLLLFDHAREKAVLEPLSADEIVTLRDAETQLATYYAIHLLGEMRGKYWNLAMTKGEHGQPIASLQDWGNEYGK